ncbi:IDEAL domain-containing protein [Paenibacillus sp. SYP-B3998]|uniref:IDEAL domain-containing protein n=1 Tax=Paenibacillus sp. SYP-B3998 TaxID=2678564 RepID=A0A6G3ZYN0_9BACL|nr:IDEAL domain-containing protein [Paenibacillus sp. SYP-B3998]NEW06689.1 IDEAL domain-containing protein [Paenibacillus sp. SYP-B3998]
MTLEISDWVQGKTEAGELIHGYIESIHELQGYVNVQVLKSDNEAAIGKPAFVPIQRLKKLADISLEAKEQINMLIDIALLTRDEAWFIELTSQLKLKQEKKGPEENSAAFPDAPSTNRLGLSGLK